MKEVKHYKVKVLPTKSIPDAILYVKADNDTSISTYITDVNGVPYPLKDDGTGLVGVETIVNNDGTISVLGTENVEISLSDAIKNIVNSALQSGDNISELVNDENYITLADIPAQETNLSSVASPTQVVITNDNGNDATILPATTTNSGVLLPTDKVKLNNTTGINSGDQTSISGISGTKAQYNTSLTDGDFLFVGDVIDVTPDATSTVKGKLKLTNDLGGTADLPTINVKTLNGTSIKGSGNILIDKTFVGLGNVDNVSDINKPVSTATQNALNLKENSFEKNTPNGYAGLGSDGKIFDNQLPALAITDTFVVSSQVSMLALTAETGDVAVRTDLNKTYILKGDDPTILGDWQELLTPTDSVSSVFGRTGNVVANNGDYTTALVPDTTDKRYVTDANLVTISNQSGINTGDETNATIISKIGYTPANDANVVHKTGDENITSGVKRWFGQTRFGISDIGSFITSGRHLTQFVAGVDQTPIALAGGNSSIEYFADLLTPRYAWATGLQNPSDNTDLKDSFKWFWAKPETPAVPYVQVMKLTEEGNLYSKGNFGENITSLTPTISGQPAIIKYVNSLNTTQPVKLVIYFHGSGANQLNPFTDVNSKYVIDKLLAEGYIVATSQAHGNAWGNQASQDDYLALYNYINSAYNITDVAYIGHSMGGLASLSMLSKNTIPKAKIWYGIMPVTNLADAYSVPAFVTPIETAYSFSGGANYAAATAGYDPQLLVTATYAGSKYTMTASASDVTVSKTNNSDLFNTKLVAGSIQTSVITATGVHGDISHFIPKSVYRFIQNIPIFTSAIGYLPRLDINGFYVDSAILDDGVNLNLGRNTRLTGSTPTFSFINSASSNKRWDVRVNGTSWMLTESGVGNQVVVAPGGVTTFTNNIITVAATTANHAVIKSQLDAAVTGAISNTLTSAGTLTLSVSSPLVSYYVFTGTTATWTLPVPSGNTTKKLALINTGSGTITVNSNASALVIYSGGLPLVNTYSLLSGSNVELYSDGTRWIVL